MGDNPDPRPAIAPLQFWRVLVVANLTSLAILMLVFHNMSQVAVMPSLAPWFLLAGLALVVPAVYYPLRSRRQDVERPAGQGENARQIKQLNRVVVGCALAELPGLMATLYYLFAREWLGTAVLLLGTLVLLLRARPR